MPSPSDDAATNNTWGFLSLLRLLLLLLLGLPACLAQSLKDSSAAAAAHTVASPSNDGAANNTWGPYASGKDFGVNMATVLVVLLCATALALALHVAFRFFVHLLTRNLDRDRARAASPAGGEDDKPPAQLPGPVVSFSSGATRVAGAPECAICLAELAEGDRVRVLPPCSHGFHAQCVEAWLVGRSSCPTCRTDCRPPPEP